MTIHVDSFELTYSEYPIEESVKEIFCIYCFQSLGWPLGSAERNRLEKEHICQEKLLARQPGWPPPFN